MDEFELVEHCRRGDETAWVRLVHLYGAYIRAIIHWPRWEFPTSAIDDVYQETLLALVKGLRTFRGEASLKTFVHRVTLRTCLYQRRQSHAQRRSPFRIDPAGDRMLDTLENPDQPDTLTALSQSELLVALRRALQQLEEPCRRIIDLRYYQERSYADISDLLKMPMGSVGVRLGRCLARLRERMEGKEIR